MENFILSNGVKMPKIGLGVYKMSDSQMGSVVWALQNGYTHIDTAAAYGNEEMIRDAIQKSGVKRENIFITTKLWNSERGTEKTKKAFDDSLKRLKMDYIDLYLIHWPAPKYEESWRVMEQFYKEGKIRAIGVSNFEESHMEHLLVQAEIVPMVDQVKTNPLKQQSKLHDYLTEKKIQHVAWGPLGQGDQELFANAVLTEIATKYGKSTAQIMLRWNLQRDIAVIPKSVNPMRLKQNLDLFDFNLTQEDMSQIATMDINQKSFDDPNNKMFLWVSKFMH